MDNSILDPVGTYEGELKNKFAKNTADYFENLVKKSGVNEAENAKTVASYNKVMENLKIATRKTWWLSFLKYFLIALVVVLVVVFAVFVYFAVIGTGPVNRTIGIVVAVICAVVAIVLIVLLCTVVRSKLKSAVALEDMLRAKAETIKNKAYQQLLPLNNLYDWKTLANLFAETTDLLKIDGLFDAKKLDYMQGKYGFQENTNQHRSTCMVQSGSICGNPFLVIKDLVHTTVDHEYTGSLTITWTEERRNSKGEMETVTRSQTLTASIIKPMPDYNGETVLVYANDAAPKLTFSREPSGVKQSDSDGSIEKMVKHKAKEIAKLSKKAIMDSSAKTNFTAMGDVAFDTLFGATDRDNEVEFRLLFTPVAQRNELKLIKDKEHYGDDFFFTKKKQLNYIVSQHSQAFDYDANPDMMVDFDIAASRKRFNEYYNEYFKNLFFDLAPLISIPLYQMYKPAEYIYKDDYASNYPSFEHETMANHIGQTFFQHPDSTTQAIMKVSMLKKDKDYDCVCVTAHSFKGVDRVALIPKMGGDGHMHDVPVPWIEYIPIDNKTEMIVKHLSDSRPDLIKKTGSTSFKDYFQKRAIPNSLAFRNGLFAFIPMQNSEISTDDMDQAVADK